MVFLKRKGDFMFKKTFLISLIIIALILVGVSFLNNNEPSSNPSGEDELITVNTKLYFSDELSSSLIAKEITFDMNENEDKFYFTLKKLILGPEDNNMYPSVNPKTVVNKVTVKDGLCTIDFSDTLTEYNTGGSTRETMCLYSIVNTMCEFPEVESVIFTVNGESISTFGQFDMSEPYKKDMSMVN